MEVESSGQFRHSLNLLLYAGLNHAEGLEGMATPTMVADILEIHYSDNAEDLEKLRAYI